MQVDRPDRVVRVLTSLVSLAYFGLLVVGIIVLVGLPVVKVLAGDQPEWVIGLTVPVASLDSGATVLTRWGEARLEPGDMHGSLRLPISMLPWWLFVLLWTYTAAAGGLILVFLYHLRRIFQHVREGAPFDITNAVRLRWLGLVALVLALLQGVAELGASLVARGGLISESLDVPLGLSLDFSLVFFGLVLLALAEVFRRGAELEEERALTI